MSFSKTRIIVMPRRIDPTGKPDIPRMGELRTRGAYPWPGESKGRRRKAAR